MQKDFGEDRKFSGFRLPRIQILGICGMGRKVGFKAVVEFLHSTTGVPVQVPSGLKFLADENQPRLSFFSIEYELQVVTRIKKV